MSSPFSYPKSIHIRTKSPPAYKNYRLYKPVLQQEFKRQCVYCRSLDAIKGYEGFGVDHYRPKKHFPHLETEYLNLLYACNRCNALKRDFWPSTSERGNGQFIPNPCEHVMFEHLRYKNGSVWAASRTGEWTIETLDLNDPDAVTFRTAYNAALSALEAQIKIALQGKKGLEKKLARATTSSEKSGIESSLEVLSDQLHDWENSLRELSGSH